MDSRHRHNLISVVEDWVFAWNGVTLAVWLKRLNEPLI